MGSLSPVQLQLGPLNGGAHSVANKVVGCHHTKDCRDYHRDHDGSLTGGAPDLVKSLFAFLERLAVNDAPSDLRAVVKLLHQQLRSRRNLRRGPIPNPARGHEILCRCRNCGEHLVQGDIRLYGKDEILEKLLNWTKPGPTCEDADRIVGCRLEFIAVPYEKAQEVEDVPETTTAAATDPTPNVEDEPTTVCGGDPELAQRFRYNPYANDNNCREMVTTCHVKIDVASKVPEPPRWLFHSESAAYGYDVKSAK